MKINWTEPAILDLESIRDYIARDAEYYATQFVKKIIEAIENLKKFPMIGRSVPEAEQEKNIKELLFHNYRIIYRIEEEHILILSVIHGARDLSQKEPKPWDII